MISLHTLISNATLQRSQLLRKMLDQGKRDINIECGYPDTIDAETCKAMYDREGIGTRVVSVHPESTWEMDPEVYETEDPTETAFEGRWKELLEDMNLYHYLHRIDEMSGIGHYGVVLLGFDDNRGLAEPVEGVTGDRPRRDKRKPPSSQPPNPTGSGTPTLEPKRELLFLRTFDETQVQISEFEADYSSPRYGLPTKYLITLHDPQLTPSAFQAVPGKQETVHWSRVLHIADNRRSSEVYGLPRMINCYNRLYDLRKLLGGSAEMFWKGAWPGFAYEADPALVESGAWEIDNEAVKEEFERYSEGLQRYISTIGLKVQSLDPQIAGPGEHVDSAIRAICIALSCPKRIFEGSERGELASSQDTRAWNGRIKRRQERYVTPMILRPFVTRLQQAGAIADPSELHVDWPDLNSPSDQERAQVALVTTQAMAAYVAGGVDVLMPPKEYLMGVLNKSLEEAEAIMEEAEQIIEEKQTQEMEQQAEAHDRQIELVQETAAARTQSNGAKGPPPSARRPGR